MSRYSDESDKLDNLVKTSKSKGYVTYDELNKSLTNESDISVDELEKAISKFSDAGIDIIEEDEEDIKLDVNIDEEFIISTNGSLDNEFEETQEEDN